MSVAGLTRGLSSSWYAPTMNCGVFWDELYVSSAYHQLCNRGSGEVA